MKEFQNRWNVIVSVLDISPDPSDVHEGFDRLSMAIRDIPKVFISSARCLSHGPKGLRPPVLKQSPLLLQAKKKQLQEQQKLLQQQQKQDEMSSPTMKSRNGVSSPSRSGKETPEHQNEQEEQAKTKRLRINNTDHII